MLLRMVIKWQISILLKPQYGRRPTNTNIHCSHSLLYHFHIACCFFELKLTIKLCVVPLIQLIFIYICNLTSLYHIHSSYSFFLLSFFAFIYFINCSVSFVTHIGDLSKLFRNDYYIYVS